MYIQLGDSFVAPFNTADATGLSVVADALPTALVVVAGVGVIGYAPPVTHLSLGDYYVTVAATTPNGFVLGQACGLWIHATVGGISGSGGLQSFNIGPTPVDTDAIAVHLLDKMLAGHTGAGTVGGALASAPSVPSIVNAILDELLSGHAVIGSVGDGIAIAAGLLQGNFLLDNTDNSNPNGQTLARIRIFRSSAAASAATPGGVGEGEFATFLVTTTYSGPNKVLTHRVVRQ